MLQHRSNGNFHIGSAFVSVNQPLRGNTEMVYGTAGEKHFLKKAFVRGAEIYSGRVHTVKYLTCRIVFQLWLVTFSGGGLEAPTNLVTSEVTHHSFRATWTAPGSPVDKYRVTYMLATGGPTEEVR